MSISDAAKSVVRRNTEEVQGQGKFEVFDQLFADDFVDHTTQPGTTPDKAGVRKLYTYLRQAFPDFHAEIHWQLADGDRVSDLAVLLCRRTAVKPRGFVRNLFAPDEAPLMKMCRAAGLDLESFSAVLRLRRRRHRFSAGAISEILRSYQALHRER